MRNFKPHQLVCTLTIGLFILHLATSSPVQKFPGFLDRSRTMDVACEDTHPNCNWIVENVPDYVDGYCQQHKKKMEGWCRRTCELCTKQPAPPNEHVTEKPTEKPETPKPETPKPETPKPETPKPEVPKTSAPTQNPNGLSAFGEDCLKAHNEFRARHNSPPLTWSTDLELHAQSWAYELASTNSFYHHPLLDDMNQGENLLWFSPPRKPCNGPQSGEDCVTCREIVKDWYDEEKDWDYNRGEGKWPGAVVLHFTQIVWKETRLMGMAIAVANNRLVAVARYAPPGNIGYPEDFRKNVSPPKQ